MRARIEPDDTTPHQGIVVIVVVEVLESDDLGGGVVLSRDTVQSRFQESVKISVPVASLASEVAKVVEAAAGLVQTGVEGRYPAPELEVAG